MCHHPIGNLDPCEWGAPIAGLAGGPSQDIRLQIGIPVVVKVVDADGHAAGRDPRRPGSVVAVTLGGASVRDRPLPLTHQGGGVYEYSYLAPANAALRVSVASGEFFLTDQSGSTIDERGQVFSIITPSSAAPVPAGPKIKPPFTVPQFGPRPVVVPVRIRGKKGL